MASIWACARVISSHPTTLGYVLGGYAWQKDELEVNGLGFGSIDWDRDGYFVGVGVETAIAGNWTLKTEYRYHPVRHRQRSLDDLGVPDGLTSISTRRRHTFHVGGQLSLRHPEWRRRSFEAPAYNWTGFYVGGAARRRRRRFTRSMFRRFGGLEFNGLGGEGIFGELNVGYDHDFGSWVAGVHGGWALFRHLDRARDSSSATRVSLDADYGFDLLARAGMKLNEIDPRLCLGGYSWQHFDIDIPSRRPAD